MDGSPLAARTPRGVLLALACLACLCTLALLSSVNPAPGLAGDALSHEVPGELVVGFKSNATDRQQRKAVDKAGGTIAETIDSIDGALVSVDPNETEAAAEELARQRAVQYVEPNYVLRASRLPN